MSIQEGCTHPDQLRPAKKKRLFTQHYPEVRKGKHQLCCRNLVIDQVARFALRPGLRPCHNTLKAIIMSWLLLVPAVLSFFGVPPPGFVAVPGAQCRPTKPDKKVGRSLPCGSLLAAS